MSVVHPEHQKLLSRQAMSRPRTTAGLQRKCKALEELTRRLDVAGSDTAKSAAKAELLWVIRTAERIGTARAQAASSMAGRLLSELDAVPHYEYPSETPDEFAPAGYWPYGPHHPRNGDGFEELSLHDTQGFRDEWRTREMGPPPWRLGVMYDEGPDDDDEDDEPEPLPDAA